jgi:K+-transporting ATPase ATPase C chain
MRRQLRYAIGFVVLLTVLTGVIYPLTVTGLAQALFRDRANGSLISDNGESLIRTDWPAFHTPLLGTLWPQSMMLHSGSNYGPTKRRRRQSRHGSMP